MQLKSTLFCLALAFCFTTACFAQDDAKATKAKERAIASQTKNMMKAFEAAKLTEEQQMKAKEIINKHIDSLLEARKAQDSLLTKDQKKARAEAVKKLKEEGVKGGQLWAKSVQAIGLSEEEQKAYDEAKKKVGEVNNKMRAAITGLLTDEQKAAMPKRKGKKGKGKKGKKNSEGKTQTVSLKLPGMTWGGCARSVRTALESVDGITEIKTNPSERKATFVAPANLDVKATLDKFADEGNRHIKGWSMDEGE